MKNICLLLSVFLLSGSSTFAGQNTGFVNVSKPSSQTGEKPVAITSYLVLSAKVLDFDNQAIQATSAPQSVTLTNAGKTGIVIKAVSATSEDFDLSQNCKAGHRTLPAGASCTILVTFTPAGAGVRQGKITILTPDAGVLEVGLRGNGVESAVTLSDTYLVFHDQWVNTRGDMQLVHLENRSETVPLSIKSIAVSEGFTLLPTRDQCTGAGAVAPRGSCNLAVSFSPLCEGWLSGVITIEDSDGASPHRVGLNGRATAVKLSTTSLAWNATAVSTAGEAQSFQISNEGCSPLRLDTIESRSDFVQHNTCGKELVPHQACVVTVVFQPVSVGNLAGSVKIRDSDVTAIQTVFLTGTGAALALSPTKLDFGEQKLVGVSPPQTVVLANRGSTDVGLRSLVVNGDFVMPSKSCGDVLAAGQSCRVSLSFSPSASGPRTGRLSVDTGAANPQSVALSGVGVEAPGAKQ